MRKIFRARFRVMLGMPRAWSMFAWGPVADGAVPADKAQDLYRITMARAGETGGLARSAACHFRVFARGPKTNLTASCDSTAGKLVLSQPGKAGPRLARPLNNAFDAK